LSSGEGALGAWLAERWARSFLRVFDEVGPGARIEGWPTTWNKGRAKIGRRFRFSSQPSPSHLLCGERAVLEIGDDVGIGHGAAIATFAGLKIGDGTRIAPFSAIMDTDFHIVGQRELHAPPEPIVIGARVRIGAHVTVLRGSTIEDDAIVEPGSVVIGRVPAGARVSGVPAREAARATAAEGSGAASVPGVVQQSLGLSAVPAPDDGPSTIPEWDSLRGLRLLLALEDAFGVVLAEDEVLRVATVGDLTGIVARAVARADRSREAGAQVSESP
jgi:acetyltransferase-like isoleucine patch superfamily enzyme/acyl carrier protein